MRRRSGRRPFQPLPAGVPSERPLVAIVGRPNVGKSTLFNRLAGHPIAIALDVPGVTRDRHYADARAIDRDFILIDTGGFDPESDDPMAEGIARQVRLALDEADVVICVLDARAEPLAADREAIRLLREANKPVLYVANKAESRAGVLEAYSLYELGIEHVLPVSALHGHNVGDLEESIARNLPPRPSSSESDGTEGLPRIAIVGRPNAGKSSLINRLSGQERQLVDDRPGTTVDSIDTLIDFRKKPYVLIDTAGIRRKRAVHGGVEGLAVLKAIRAMERSDVVVLMIDGAEGPAEQDAKIVGLAEERGCALVLVLNKADLLDEQAEKRVTSRTREIVAFAPYASVVRTSMTKGRGLARLFAEIDTALASRSQRVSTAEMNRFFQEVLERHPPPTHQGRAVRLYYVTQAAVAPPTFIVVTNQPDGVHFSYQRYVINQIRERFGFEGTPIRVRYRSKRRDET